MECSICYEVILAENILQCTNCNKHFCWTCYKTWLNEQKSHVSCPTCNNSWLLRMHYIFKPEHYPTLKAHEAKIIISEHEKNILSVAVDAVDLHRKISFLSVIHTAALNKYNTCRLLTESKKFAIRESMTRDKLYKARQNLRHKYFELRDGKNTNSANVAIGIYKCTVKNCSGYVNSLNSCTSCRKEYCSKCKEVAEDKHKCDPETLQTIKLIEKDSKHCPVCKAYTHKIEGCYQMWCTICHTSWDWGTGEVVNERIHNPHYISWVNQNKNNQNQQACNQQVNRYQILTMLNNNRGNIMLRYSEIVIPQALRRNDFVSFDHFVDAINYIEGNFEPKHYNSLLVQRTMTSIYRYAQASILNDFLDEFVASIEDNNSLEEFFASVADDNNYLAKLEKILDALLEIYLEISNNINKFYNLKCCSYLHLLEKAAPKHLLEKAAPKHLLEKAAPKHLLEKAAPKTSTEKVAPKAKDEKVAPKARDEKHLLEKAVPKTSTAPK